MNSQTQKEKFFHTFIANDEFTGTLYSELNSAFSLVSPNAVNLVTAYLTPDGFRAIKDQINHSNTVRILLGERPFFSRKGPQDVLMESSEGVYGPEEQINWYNFLEGNIPVHA